VTDRRSQILAAALQVFTERAYCDASLAAVAERVGLTEQDLQQMFPAKDGLLTEVMRLRDELVARAFTGFSGTLADVEAVVAWNSTRAGLVQSFTALAARSLTDGHPGRDFFASRYGALRAALARQVCRELGDPGPSGLTSEQVAALLVAVMDGLQLQWLAAPECVDMTGLVRAFLQLLHAGIEPDERSPAEVQAGPA
jgi:AcrR family transcriptional regulator